MEVRISMNINFHYFAVKVLAVKAGFNTDDAQTIAKYSQFVDDFILDGVRNYQYVPEFARYLATQSGEYWRFNNVRTGFDTLQSVDLSGNAGLQKSMLIPFHFITAKSLTNIDKSNRKNYRTVPVKMDTPSLLSDLLKNAREEYLFSPSHSTLIKISILIHTFADSYAHQLFSGFKGWENASYIVQCIDNNNNSDITASYKPQVSAALPHIGHANLLTAADDSNVTFDMVLKNSETESYPYSYRYTRSNTEEFLIAAKEILNYLLSLRGKDKINDADWNIFSPLLRRGLLATEKTNVEVLKSYWRKIFSDITFYYVKEELYYIESGSQLQNEDFFYYNVFADKIRRQVDSSIT
jgi:hypothetical protein